MSLPSTSSLPGLSIPAQGSFAALNILDVPVGRELDALVAEHVLGWRWIASVKCLGSTDLEDARIVREHWERVVHKDVTDVQRPARAADWDTALPHFSTSGDALEILQAMTARNFQYQILKTPKQCHMVSFTSRSGTTDESAFDESLPEAICHAALMAVLREQKNH